jgi:hypothetical protein
MSTIIPKTGELQSRVSAGAGPWQPVRASDTGDNERQSVYLPDLCELVTSVITSGNRFIFLLVDDFGFYIWATLLKYKDQAMAVFMAFQACAEAEAKRKLGTLRTDRCGEFMAWAFIDYCTKEGI